MMRPVCYGTLSACPLLGMGMRANVYVQTLKAVAGYVPAATRVKGRLVVGRVFVVAGVFVFDRRLTDR